MTNASVSPVIEAQLAVEKEKLARAKRLHPSQFEPTIERKTLGGWLADFKTAQRSSRRKVQGSAA
jgi:hypothetical protein